MKTFLKTLLLFSPILLGYPKVFAQTSCPYRPVDCRRFAGLGMPAADPTICAGSTFSFSPSLLIPPGTSITSWSWSPSSTVSPSGPGTGIPSGIFTFSPPTTTTYTLSVSGLGPNVINDGDFESWTSSSPCFYSGYTLYSPISIGNYNVGTNPALFSTLFSSMHDHTSGSGNMLIAHGFMGVSTVPVWEEDNIPVCPSAEYAFQAWFANVYSTVMPHTPSLQIVITDASSSSVLYTSSTYSSTTLDLWTAMSFNWTNGSSTNVNIQIFDLNTDSDGETAGDGFALDDISFQKYGSESASFTVNVAPMPTISGPITVCPGNTIPLTVDVSGGTWSSSDATIASVDGSGNVTGISGGGCTITYVTSAGCIGTYPITVYPAVPPITGITELCLRGEFVLDDAATGGTWSSSSGGVTLASGPSIGHFFTWSPVASTITYALPDGCSTSILVTVDPLPNPMTTITICNGSSTTLYDSPSPGTWSSSTPSIASIITATGVLSAASLGSATITYTSSAGCTTTVPVDVVDCSSSGGGIVSSSSSICSGGTIWLSIAIGIPTGGTWSSSDISVATVDPSTGEVTAVSEGVVTITYTSGSYTASVSLTIYPIPGACVTADPLAATFTFTYTTGATIFYYTYDYFGRFVGSGYLSPTGTSVTYDYLGLIAASYPSYSGGSGFITVCIMSVYNSDMCFMPIDTCCASINPGHHRDAPSDVKPINTTNSEIQVVPDPSNGNFTIIGGMDKTQAGVVQIEIIDMTGKVVHTESAEITNSTINKAISMNSQIPNGTYIIKLVGDTENHILKLVLNR